MKAREIKKLVEGEYKSRIQQHKSIEDESKIKIEIAEAQIREVEFLRSMLFNIEDRYNVTTRTIEKGESVPF